MFSTKCDAEEMNVTRSLSLLQLPFLLHSLASPEKRRNESLSAGTCVIHHVKLQEKTLYGFNGCQLFESYVYKVYDRFPNAIPPSYSEKRSKYGHARHEKVTYCELCDKQATEIVAEHYKER